jgi:hypothetical protein
MASLTLKYCEHFNLQEHSYLLHIEIEGSDNTVDPNILVVKDIPATPGPSSSGSSDSGTSTSGSSGEGAGDDFMEMSLLPVESGSSSNGSSETSGETDPGESSSITVSSEVPSHCEVEEPHRVLLSVASLGDMRILPTTSPGLHMLYRTDRVSLISNSKEMMDRLLQHLMEDVKTNARLQGLENPYFETFEARDAVPGSNDDENYPFR